MFAASSTQLIASFYQLSQHNYGLLDVVVTRDPSTVSLLSTANADQVKNIGNLDSTAQTVASVNPVLSMIQTSTVEISSDSLYLTISGTGFSGTNITTNVLTFTAAGGTRVMGVANSASRTNLVVKFSKLAISNVGDLYVSNEVQTDSANWTSLSRQVATVIATTPFFEPSPSTILSSDSTLLTLKGTGFDASDPTQQSVIFKLTNSTSTFDVTGEVMTVSMTQLVVQFHTLGASNEGTLYATVVVDGSYSTLTDVACQVVSTAPKLTSCGNESECSISESSNVSFTLHGLGFAQTDYGECTNLNEVTLTPLDLTQPDLYATITNCRFTYNTYIHTHALSLSLSFLYLSHSHTHNKHIFSYITKTQIPPTDRYENDTYNVMDHRAIVL